VIQPCAAAMLQRAVQRKLVQQRFQGPQHVVNNERKSRLHASCATAFKSCDPCRVRARCGFAVATTTCRGCTHSPWRLAALLACMARQATERRTGQSSCSLPCKPQLRVPCVAGEATATVFAAAELQTGNRKLPRCPTIIEQRTSMQQML
jgi:hypothetical protein